MVDTGFIYEYFEVIDTRIDGEKKKEVINRLTGYTELLDIDATEEEINQAKEKIVNDILKYYEVVEEEGIPYLKLRQEYE